MWANNYDNINIQIKSFVPKTVDGSTRDLRDELEQGGELTDWSEGLSHVVYQPTSEEQKAAQMEGVSGQFKVKYQVEMKPEGEVQVN